MIVSLEMIFKKYGWLSCMPAEVIKTPDGKLKIIDGHNRFRVARKLGIMVKVVEVPERDDPVNGGYR